MGATTINYNSEQDTDLNYWREVDILAQLGIPERTFPQQCGDILLKLLSNEQNSKVLASIGFAFGHLKDSRSVFPLVKLKNHPDSGVRYGVAFGLICSEDELAIQALIDLSSDKDEDVRNWATFGLGSQNPLIILFTQCTSYLAPTCLHIIFITKFVTTLTPAYSCKL